MKNNLFLVCVILSLVLFLAGCGQTKVEGKITFPDGTPLSKGKIIFESDIHTLSAVVQSNGTFRMGMLKDGEGIPCGKYKVGITEAFDAKYSDKPVPPEITHFIAEKFRSPKTSGIEYDIQKTTKDISIVVEKP
ncbi:MAG: hypothetical protein LBT09_12390 [Planctomycetaceae bacterium]|jgi:hypothetical protein|nr:hypothetical protein [Planctomycetaceae bacterium]